MKKLVAKVKFIQDVNTNYDSFREKEYNFQTDIEDLVLGDSLVVETVNGLRIAKFTGYIDLGFGINLESVTYPSKWVIQKIDLSTHNKRKENAERVEKLKIMLENERKKAAELEIYEILAKTNPEMKTLLEEYKTLKEEI